MEIKKGGVEIKFKNNENEMEKDEDYFDNENWVRYFIKYGKIKI